MFIFDFVAETILDQMRGTSWADCICRMSIRTSAEQSII